MRFLKLLRGIIHQAIISEMPFSITNIVYTFHFYHLLFVLLHERNHSLSLNLYMLLVSFNLLKISENQRSSDVFRRNRKRAMTSNGLILRRMVSLEINLGKLLVSVLLKRQNRSWTFLASNNFFEREITIAWLIKFLIFYSLKVGVRIQENIIF